MSRVRELLTHREAGFSLVEVLVSFVLLALVAAALFPLFVVGARAATTTRMETQGKNLAQERLEQMRQLAFHVDRQNGPFVDLLDLYYPNRTAAAGTGAGWVSETSTTRLPGEPATGPFYRVSLAPVPGFPDFSQTIATQFLRFNRAPVGQAEFATYNSQTTGLDNPPSLFLGVSVATTWTAVNEQRRFETFTQFSDPGAPQALIATQARAVALRAESTAPGSTTFLTAQAAEAYADGRLSDGSTSAVTVSAGRATRTDVAPTEAATATAVAPGAAQAGTVTSTAMTSGGGSCGYAAFGRASGSNVTASILDGVPLAPANVGAGTTPAFQSQAALLANPGGTCGAYWFHNLSTTTVANLQLRSDRPLVSVPGAISGSAPIVEAKAWVNGTSETAAPRFVRAGASASTPEAAGLFYTSFNPADQPLVRMRLTASSITCDSSSTPPATASYSLNVEYRTATGSYQSLTGGAFTWSSTTGPTTDPLAAVDLTTKTVYGSGPSTLTLADYISSWSLGTAMTEGSNGVAGLDAALRITTVPVRPSGDVASSVGLTLGELSCVADDNR